MSATFAGAVERAVRLPLIPRQLAKQACYRILVQRPPSEASQFVKRFSCDAIVEEVALRDDLVEQIVRTRKSLIRFGDGEVRQLIGKDLPFQVSSPELRKVLFQAYFNYADSGPYLLAVPHLVRNSVELLKQTPSNKGSLWGLWQKARGLESLAMQLGCRATGIYDSLAFRERRVSPNPIWDDASDVCIVTNPRVQQLAIESGDFSRTRVHFVSIPEFQALSSVPRVCEEVELVFRRYCLSPQDVPVLVAGGTVAKLIVFSLMRDFWMVDVGSWMGPMLPKSEFPR